MSSDNNNTNLENYLYQREEAQHILEALRKFSKTYTEYVSLFDRLTFDDLFLFLYDRSPCVNDDELF